MRVFPSYNAPYTMSNGLLNTTKRHPALWLAGAFCLSTTFCFAAPALRVAAFQCDITPPPGEALVWTVPLTKVVQPLQAKGVVLEAGTNRYVLCALDWCLVGNETEASFRAALAQGAGTTAERVAVQSIHQHAAPYADEGAHRLLDGLNPPILHLSTSFLDTVRSRLSGAASQASQQLEPFDQIGFAQTKVEQIASERRLKGPDGKIVTRYSSGAKDPKMAQAPEGNIDPYLKTITFARRGKALARLHYYATHPQTFCCDGRASSDFVGLARETVEKEQQVPQVYFTGCSGNVTAGKYNDGSDKAYSELTARLKAAMEQAAKNTRYVKAKELVWRTYPLTLPLRGDKDQIAAQSRAWLQDSKQPDSFRVYMGAMRLAFVQRLEQPVELNSLQIGKVHIIHLPGEPMLDYQFYAQQRKASEFVAVAGYGDCGTAYICTDQALTEGGYEPEATNVGKGTEARLKQAIDALLGLP
jgi:hypothetical protein